MRSITKTAIAFTVTLVGVTCALASIYWPAAIELGAEHGDHVSKFRGALAKRAPGRAIVAWLGDSTIFPSPGHKTYPELLRPRLSRRLDVGTLTITKPGLDFFHFYSLTGRVLERKPRVIVYVANPRLFTAVSPMEARNDLCTLIDPSELSRAVALPWHVRGMTIPRVLGCPLLAHGRVRDAAFFLDGMRRTLREAELWGAAEPPGLQPSKTEYLEEIDRMLAAYDTPITHTTAMTRMLAATVELASRGGVRVLVVVTPLPTKRLESVGYYDSDRFERRVAVLADVVERAGGRLVDLHALLDDAEFRDNTGHFTVAGTARVADAMLPELEAEFAELRIQ